MQNLGNRRHYSIYVVPQSKKRPQILRKRPKNNYELKELAPGIPAYLRKKSNESINFAVWICPYCYNQKKESFLQCKYHAQDMVSYNCPYCKTPFEWNHSKPLGHEKSVELFAPRIGNKK
jgi:hypothetical protein